MKKIASNELKEFLQDWLDWAEAGGVGDDFETMYGLCDNAQEKWDKADVTCDLRMLLCGRIFPFGSDEYYECVNDCTMHQDPNRLAWVRAALNDTLDTWELME